MANGAIVLNLMCVERRETGLLLGAVFVDEAGFQLKQRRRQLDKATKYKQIEEKNTNYLLAGCGCCCGSSVNEFQ